ncbi:MAG: hypothetical protein IJO80_06535 [Firmicutes bacterium]|nr:hypothetical protein [Bacillota bacterium]
MQKQTRVKLSHTQVIGGFGFIIWDDVLRYRGDFKKYHLHSKPARTMSSTPMST